MRRLLETTCNLEKVAVIFNPASGTGDYTTRRSTLEALAKDAGLSCGLVETEREHGAAPLAEEALKNGNERVLVSGGDGSVTEAAQVLTGTKTALAVLPGGTGNLLALNLGIPADGERAMELALTGGAAPFDVGRANGHVFLILAGIGADGRMIRQANREAKRRLGVLAYFVAACQNLGQQLTVYEIEIDGQRLRRRAHTVMAANLGRITGGIELVPGTDPHDGLLDVAILRARGLPDLARLAARIVLGRNYDPHLMELHRGRRIVITTRRPQPVEIDGNEAGVSTRLEVQVEPDALNLVCPACSDEAAPSAAAVIGAPALIPVAIPLLAAAGASAIAIRQSRKRGSRAASVAIPAAAGIAAATAATLLAGLLLRRQRTPETDSGEEPGKGPAENHEVPSK